MTTQSAEEVRHQVTISPIPTSSPFIRPGSLYSMDWVVECLCGQTTTCSYRRTAEQRKIDHLEDGDPLEWPDDDELNDGDVRG